MIGFLKKNWYFLIIVALAVILILQFKKNYHVIQKTDSPEESKKIEALRDSVNNLVKKMKNYKLLMIISKPR